MDGLATYALVITVTICVLVGIVAFIGWLAEQFSYTEDDVWWDDYPEDERDKRLRAWTWRGVAVVLVVFWGTVAWLALKWMEG